MSRCLAVRFALAYRFTSPRLKMKRVFVLLTPLVILCVSVFLVSRQTAAPITLNSLLQMQRGVKPNASSASGLTTSPALSKFNQETRALWVVRFTLTSPEAVRASVQRAKENGFTDLVVQVRGRGDAFYNSQWEPRADGRSSIRRPKGSRCGPGT